MAIDLNRRKLLVLTGAAALGSAAVIGAAQTPPRVIEMVARKFTFLPDELRLQRGETVTLQFTAPEVPMSFYLPDFKLRTDIVPGKISTVEFTPDRTGTFTFLCDVFCGSGHEDMSGLLIVN